jgi:hypothetical protein
MILGLVAGALWLVAIVAYRARHRRRRPWWRADVPAGRDR